jgi:hypothetical protein
MSLATDALKVEKFIDHKLADALNTGTKIITAATTAIQKLAVAENQALPAIEAVETNPIWAAISADIPGTGAIEQAILKVLNRYQPYISAAATDPQILRGLQQDAISELASAIHGAQNVIDWYIGKVIKFFDVLGI